MLSRIILDDLQCDGAMPVNGEIFVDRKSCMLKINIEKLGFGVWIPLKEVTQLLSEVLDGS